MDEGTDYFTRIFSKSKKEVFLNRCNLPLEHNSYLVYPEKLALKSVYLGIEI